MGMGFWAWLWIWTGLVVAALVLLGFIGKSLFNKLSDAGHQVARLADRGMGLAKAAQDKPVVQAPESSILADPTIAQARVRALRRAKVKKHEQRQRRLIKSLKRFDPNESRFH